MNTFAQGYLQIVGELVVMFFRLQQASKRFDCPARVWQWSQRACTCLPRGSIHM